MRRNRVVYRRLACQLYDQLRRAAHSERGGVVLAECSAGPDGAARYFGTGPGIRTALRKVIVAATRRLWFRGSEQLASAGGSRRRRGEQRPGFGRGPGSAARTTTSLLQNTRYGVGIFGERGGFGGVGKRTSPLVGFGWRERNAGGPGPLNSASAQDSGKRSAELAHGWSVGTYLRS